MPLSFMLPVSYCSENGQPHDHIDCLAAKFLATHDHAFCVRNLRHLSGEDRFCGIADDGSHGEATHVAHGFTAGRPRRTPCFAQIYGPHNCVGLDCQQPCAEGEELRRRFAQGSPEPEIVAEEVPRA